MKSKPVILSTFAQNLIGIGWMPPVFATDRAKPAKPKRRKKRK